MPVDANGGLLVSAIGNSGGVGGGMFGGISAPQWASGTPTGPPVTSGPLGGGGGADGSGGVVAGVGSSIVNNLTAEGYDIGMSLPSLGCDNIPTVGEDFPSAMQSEIAAEETVTSTDEAKPVTSHAAVAVSSAVTTSAGAMASAFIPSLDRKIDDFQMYSHNVN